MQATSWCRCSYTRKNKRLALSCPAAYEEKLRPATKRPCTIPYALQYTPIICLVYMYVAPRLHLWVAYCKSLVSCCCCCCYLPAALRSHLSVGVRVEALLRRSLGLRPVFHTKMSRRDLLSAHREQARTNEQKRTGCVCIKKTRGGGPQGNQSKPEGRQHGTHTLYRQPGDRTRQGGQSDALQGRGWGRGGRKHVERAVGLEETRGRQTGRQGGREGGREGSRCARRRGRRTDDFYPARKTNTAERRGQHRLNISAQGA